MMLINFKLYILYIGILTGFVVAGGEKRHTKEPKVCWQGYGLINDTSLKNEGLDPDNDVLQNEISGLSLNDDEKVRALLKKMGYIPESTSNNKATD